MHGYALIKELDKHFDGLLDSTVYSILRRLEKKDILSSKVIKDESRNKKVYKLTEQGISLLEDYKYEYTEMFNTLKILEAEVYDGVRQVFVI